jgi:Dolichyl-phosphate-mannose-protein mannosyltransferase
VTLISPTILEFAGLLSFVFFICIFVMRQGVDRPRAIIDAFLLLAIVSYASTEILGLLGQIAFYPFLFFWIVANGWAGYQIWQRRHRRWLMWKWEHKFPFWIVVAFASVTLFIALTAEPNNWDSMTYRLPRIEHWIQDGSLAYYPTSIGMQNFGPLAEILLLQTRVLSGSHRFYLLIQWVSMLCSISAVFRITRQLGGNTTQAWIACAFLATLPIGILESTSTQNDYVVAALLVSFVSLGLQAITEARASLWLVLAAAAAGLLTGLVKPTGYLLGVGFAVWFSISLATRVSLTVVVTRAAGIMVLLAIFIAPFATRFATSLAEVSEIVAKDIVNGSFGVKQTLDNLIRGYVLNLLTGIQKIDTLTSDATKTITSQLGLDTHRQETSIQGYAFSKPPVGQLVLHEDYGPNPIHLIVVTAALALTASRWPESTPTLLLLYWGAWLIGVAALAAVLRWNPWAVRYHLAAFALVAPAVATAWPTKWSDSKKAVAFFLALAIAGIPALFFSYSRQLIPLSQDKPSYLTSPPIERLFFNRRQLLPYYRDAVDVFVQSNASQIGLVMGDDSWEYPIWTMLRERKLGHFIRIEHVAVDDERWPLGPFTPDVLFWDRGEAPPRAVDRGSSQSTCRCSSMPLHKVLDTETSETGGRPHAQQSGWLLSQGRRTKKSYRRRRRALGARCRLFDEPLGKCLGQRRDGELLLVAQDRAHRSQNVPDPRRGES